MRIMVLLSLLTAIWVGAVSTAAAQCKGCTYSPGGGQYVCFEDPNCCWYECVGGATCTYGAPCGGPAGCFLPGMMVETPGGPKAIHELVVGDEVVSLRTDGALEHSRVVRTYRAIGTGYYIINDDIRVTGAHPFKVGDRWLAAEDLRIGDELIGLKGVPTIVESLQKSDRWVRVCNIEVEGTHTFFVGGFLVHNKPGDDDPFGP